MIQKRKAFDFLYFMSNIILSAEKISKQFGSSFIEANSNVDFSLVEGEIHTVAGENGSGKSTLMHILSGLIKPSSGKILLKGKEVIFASPKDALEKGIGMIYQRVGIINSFSALDNIILGHEESFLGVINRKKLSGKIISVMDEFGLSLSLDKIPTSPKEKQITALISLLCSDTKIVIIDEPVASLSLTKLAEKLIQKGKTVIIITHKIEAALSMSNRITVLAKGKLKGTFKCSDTSIEEVASLMTTEHYSEEISNSKAEFFGNVVFSVGENTQFFSSDISRKKFTISQGEILAVTGIRDKNFNLFEDFLAEKCKNGKYIPSDRAERGASLNSAVWENLVFTRVGEFSKQVFPLFRFLKKKEISLFFEKAKEIFHINGVMEQPLWQLSGGNIQKIIIFRELYGVKELALICEPTVNLDMESRKIIYHAIRNLTKKGIGVILLSTDMDEVIELANRVAVMDSGKITTFLEGEDINKYNIANLMLGLTSGTTKLSRETEHAGEKNDSNT